MNQFDERRQAIVGREVGEGAIALNAVTPTTLDHVVAKRLHLARRRGHVRHVNAEVLHALAALRQELLVHIWPLE